MSIIKQREARRLPCPVCGQSCSEDYALRYLEAQGLRADKTKPGEDVTADKKRALSTSSLHQSISPKSKDV